MVREDQTSIVTRPRVLLCPDTPNWAYDNICDHIERNLSDQFEFRRYYMAGVAGYPEVFLNQVFMIMEKFDILHLFWREDVHYLTNPDVIYKAATAFRRRPEEFFDAIARVVVTSSVYDHLHLEPEHFAWRERAFSFLDGYSVSSDTLHDVYRSIDAFPDPVAMISDGVDTEFFRPHNTARLTQTERPLIVGWVGNPDWGNDPERDPKGVRSILEPALESLAEDGLEVHAKFADSTRRLRSRAEMAEYYGEIDVLVCASEIEGTPNPVLEAMASGVPIVSTRVGIVPQALGPRQSEFILKERTVDCMAACLRRLANDRVILAELSAENIQRVQQWTWEKNTMGWVGFWETTARRHQIRQPLKAQLLRERYNAWYADNVKYNDRWPPASGAAVSRRSAKERIAGWVRRNPLRSRLYDRLRGRR